MKCPKCQFANREGAKFCIKCGEKYQLKCPQCDNTLPIEAIFCDECGHNLTIQSEPAPKDLSLDEKLEKIQKYLPKGITEKILAQRDGIEGERKQVTVLFCDMEGFTGLSEKIDPEEVYSTMDQVYEILIHKVRDYEGTVNEMTGDGIMALFGAPIALEDAPQRAIRSAYAIHREMARFNDRMKQEKPDMLAIKMRVGIHTGPVVVGTLGNDLRVEFKAVGDTVNLASRMEGLAEPGSTFVTEDTFRLTEGLFRFEALGEKEVKGKEKPVQVYRVIAPSTRRTRFDVSAERGLTPFAGRERELELLLDDFERSKTGRGQVISIMAEAGVGKSRLLYEFRKAVSNEDVTFQEGKCLSYSKAVPYHPIIDIVKTAFDITDGDGDSEIREKLKQGLEILGADEASTLPYILEFLSVKGSGIDTINLSFEARKDRTIEALKRIALQASQIRPLIMAVEDLHWIDKSSEDYLKDLLDSIAGAMVFLIFTYRPEFVHTWGAKSYHSQVTLNRLSNRESIAMVSHLLGEAEIHGDLEDFILEKTEGVPFFIEEFIKSLKALKIIERTDNQYLFTKDFLEMTIPSTIQDVIMARVDTLPESAKYLLQAGSVIESEFSYELIKHVSCLSEQDLLSRLSILKNTELIYERGIFPESIYVFKHALTQEVVYDSILTSRRKRLHNKIGEAIEKLYPHKLQEYYGILIEHYIKSENYEKSAEYSLMAGQQAIRAGNIDNAIAYGEKQVDSLDKLQQTAEVKRNIIDARTKLGLYYAQIAYNLKAKSVIDPIVDLAIEKNYKRRVSHLYFIIGQYKWQVEENFPQGFKYLEKALKIGKELNDILTLALANLWIGLFQSFYCEFAEGHKYLEKALEINVSANRLWAISILKAWKAPFYFFQGRIDLAYKTSNEALRIADESGDIFSKAHAYTFHGRSCYGKGYLEEAEEHLLKAVDFSERVKQLLMVGYANEYLGETYFTMGQYEKSQRHYERAIFVFQHGSLYPSYVHYYKIAHAKAKVIGSENGIDLEFLYRLAHGMKIKLYESSVQRHISEILLNINDQYITEAEDWIKRAIETNKKYGMMWNLAQDYTLYAELFKRKGDPSKARENLNKAIEIFKECGADGWVNKYEKELASLD
ncbi:adenylate/guanylate cyclase domain-containing protein [Thermodesulfobacteriota bacterium]